MFWAADVLSELIPRRVEEVKGRKMRERKLGIVLAIMMMEMERVKSLG